RREDLGVKKELYERTFRTSEYFCYDMESAELSGWSLQHGRYRPIEPGAKGRLRCDVLGLFLGHWQGVIHKHDRTWLRFFAADGDLVPLPEEAERARADVERARADTERERAMDAEEEVRRLRARIEALEVASGRSPRREGDAP
ncbi:MAG: hypothetical protein HYV63_32990, partial [Candidatus Schekmanbacteria bacterium]|nr:hypothetical protein [Candidatus Schekmanbacteria bacterium]